MVQVHGGKTGAEILLVGGVVAQYVAARLSISALVSGDGSTPGRLALGQWLPICATGIAAAIAGQQAMAVSLVFGSSVAALSLVLGMTLYVAPVHAAAPQRRLWALVLPVAILLLLAGFRGMLTWYHAIMLLIMGAAFLGVWVERRPEQSEFSDVPPVTQRPTALLIPGLALAALGAYAAVRGAGLTGSRLLTPNLLGATILSPLLLLPALGTGTVLAQQGHTDRSITSLCGVVLLNLCLLLPVLILIQYATDRGGVRMTAFPLITWRVDSVLLVVLGFVLAGFSTGRWIPERMEAILLVIVYAAYLLAETILSAGLLA